MRGWRQGDTRQSWSPFRWAGDYQNYINHTIVGHTADITHIYIDMLFCVSTVIKERPYNLISSSTLLRVTELNKNCIELL